MPCWEVLTETERRHPVFVAAQEPAYGQVCDWGESLIDEPVGLDQLQPSLLAAVPALAELYLDYPDTPPLFHVDQTLAAIRAARQRGEFARILWLQLMCLKLLNAYTPVDPRADPGLTVDYCRERAQEVASQFGFILHVSETFRVCVMPALEAGSERLGLAATRQPSRTMYDVTGLFTSAELICTTAYEGAHVVEFDCQGAWAMKLAKFAPRMSKIDLTKQSPVSTFFDGSPVRIGYHPRVHCGSRFALLRSYSLLREIVLDALRHGLTDIPARYAARGAARTYQVYALDEIANVLELDFFDESPANLRQIFRILSEELMELVSSKGTGTHGYGVIEGGPVYNGPLQISTSAGGGCTSGSTWSGAVTVGDVEGFAGLSEKCSSVLETDDFDLMRILLDSAGFVTEEYENARIRSFFKRALPLLVLKEHLLELDCPLVADFVESSLADVPLNDAVQLVKRLGKLSPDRFDYLARVHELLGIREPPAGEGEVGSSAPSDSRADSPASAPCVRNGATSSAHSTLGQDGLTALEESLPSMAISDPSPMLPGEAPSTPHNHARTMPLNGSENSSLNTSLDETRAASFGPPSEASLVESHSASLAESPSAMLEDEYESSLATTPFVSRDYTHNTGDGDTHEYSLDETQSIVLDETQPISLDHPHYILLGRPQSASPGQPHFAALGRPQAVSTGQIFEPSPHRDDLDGVAAGYGEDIEHGEAFDERSGIDDHKPKQQANSSVQNLAENLAPAASVDDQAFSEQIGETSSQSLHDAAAPPAALNAHGPRAASSPFSPEGSPLDGTDEIARSSPSPSVDPQDLSIHSSSSMGELPSAMPLHPRPLLSPSGPSSRFSSPCPTTDIIATSGWSRRHRSSVDGEAELPDAASSAKSPGGISSTPTTAAPQALSSGLVFDADDSDSQDEYGILVRPIGRRDRHIKSEPYDKAKFWTGDGRRPHKAVQIATETLSIDNYGGPVCIYAVREPASKLYAREWALESIYCDEPVAETGLKDESLRWLVGRAVGFSRLSEIGFVYVTRWEAPSTTALFPCTIRIVFKTDAACVLVQEEPNHSAVYQLRESWKHAQIAVLRRRVAIDEDIFQGLVTPRDHDEHRSKRYKYEYIVHDIHPADYPQHRFGMNELKLRYLLAKHVGTALVPAIHWVYTDCAFSKHNSCYCVTAHVIMHDAASLAALKRRGEEMKNVRGWTNKVCREMGSKSWIFADEVSDLYKQRSIKRQRLGL